MIGIDIVDLSDPLLKSRTARSLKLILHPDDYYPSNKYSFWLLWSAKEAVFKSRRELVPFKPTDFVIRIEHSDEGVFTYRSGKDQGYIFANYHFICAVGGVDVLPSYRVFFSHRAEDKGYIRHKISSYLGSDNVLSSDHLGLPVSSPSGQQISVSHHHRYAAFAISPQTFG